jgi:CheY-like chemotaxis protein
MQLERDGDVTESAGLRSASTLHPPARTALPEQTGAESLNGGQSVPRRRILVADDDRDGADSLALLLGLLGHDVRTAYDGEGAVAAAEECRPQIILLDVGMPRLNGYDACRRIRQQPWSAGMILVACTGWGREEDIRRARDAGFHHHLVKPIDPAALQALISSALPGDPHHDV